MAETSTGTNSERVATVLGLVALAIACVLFAFIGVVLAFFTDSCGVASTTCDAGLVAVGTAVAGVIPWLLTVAATIAAALRLRHGAPIGSLAWVSLLVAVLIAAIGVGIVFFGGGFEFGALANQPPPAD